MNCKNSGIVKGTSGSGQMTVENSEARVKAVENEAARSVKKPIFSKSGHVTPESISARAEFFLGKSVAKIEHVLQNNGYITTRRASIHSGSNAKIIVTTNQTRERNIQQIQVSPGSKRHGGVPYVKISTSDYGRFKIIGADSSSYISDGKEKATLLFRRKK